jgi:hypothetical protein
MVSTLTEKYSNLTFITIPLRRIYATKIVECSTEHSARFHLIMTTPRFEVGPALLQSLCVSVFALVTGVQITSFLHTFILSSVTCLTTIFFHIIS